MPQMSPMLWFNLMIYFFFMFIIMMTLIYNFIIYKNMNNNLNKLSKINYIFKW